MDDDLYHYDFTTVSELEIFIAHLEKIIQEWELHLKQLKEPLQKNFFKTKKWCSSTEVLNFAEAKFTLTRYYLKCDVLQNKDDSDNSEEEKPGQVLEDMMSTQNDFINILSTRDPPEIARWFGLRDYLVLTPESSSYRASESRIKIILSSLSIAASNTKCSVPIFLEALEPWQSYFLGTYQSGSFKTDFNMVHLKRTPLYCKCLTGLLTMFKSKIGLGMNLNQVSVSVLLTYALKNWSVKTWIREAPDVEFFGSDIYFKSQSVGLPFGCLFDSINTLYLHAIWPFLLENSVADGENYSDLEPLYAPLWKVSLPPDSFQSGSLSDHFIQFLSLAEVKHSIKELLGNFITSNNYVSSTESEVSSSLNALTESKISAFSKAVIGSEKIYRKESFKNSQNSDPIISSESLMTLLYYLFPDADKNSKFPYSENIRGISSSNFSEEKSLESNLKRLSGMKSAPYDGLLWRLSIAMAYVVRSLGGASSAAYFWYEFTQELRYRWENGILIPGLELGLLDLRTCLLNQKLQLLNCCISRKIQRDKQANEKSEDSDSEGDEFFDCDAEYDEEEAKSRKIKQTFDKPEGRLTKHGELKLLKTGKPLYIPITQESVSKTEDQLEEDIQVLLKLGNDALGSELRAKMLSVYLLSDMEAFKAANPDCVLADFIRWCSPRDWIEDESGELDKFGQKKGHLSSRMEIPNNTWVEVWETARPVPAKRQKRLFNDTKEAEKVLDYLERKTPGEFIELLLPVFIVCVIHKLLEKDTGEVPQVNEILAKLIKKAERLGKVSKISGKLYKDLVDDICEAEKLLIRLDGLKQKFSYSNENPNPELMEFIKNLLLHQEAEVPGGPKSEIGLKIQSFFSENDKEEQLFTEPGNQLTNKKWNVMSPLSSPEEKEMILRVSTNNGPQRLHAILNKKECRICGAFTKNVYIP